MKNGMAYISKDRDMESVALDAPIFQNIAISGLDRNQRIKPIISRKQEKQYVNNSFNTLNSNGNPSLSAAILTTSGKITLSLALVLNGIYGDIDTVLVDGKPAVYDIMVWICYSPEEYALINKVDSDENSYIFNADEFKQMIKFYNEDLTADSLRDFALEYSSLESVFERRGIH